MDNVWMGGWMYELMVTWMGGWWMSGWIDEQMDNDRWVNG